MMVDVFGLEEIFVSGVAFPIPVAAAKDDSIALARYNDCLTATPTPPLYRPDKQPKATTKPEIKTP